MGRTRTQLRQAVAREFPGGMISSTVDGSGSSTTVIKDAGVLDRYKDNHFIGAHVYLTSGNPSNDELRVSDSDQSDGTVTIYPTLGAAPDSLNYEILPYSATEIHQALEDSMLEAYDRGLLQREFWLSHWLTGSPIYNSTMDYWTSATQPDGWVASAGSFARVQATSTSVYVVPGQSVNTMESGTAATYQLTERYEPFLADFRGYTPVLRAWVYATAASAARIQLLVDNAVHASSDYHSGNSTWQVLTLTPSTMISVSANRINVAFNHAAVASTSYIGAIWLEQGPLVTEYPFPIRMMPNGPEDILLVPASVNETDKTALVNAKSYKTLGGWSVRRWRDEAADSDMGVLMFEQGSLPPGYRLMMKGSGVLTIPSTNAGVVEVSQVEAQLLAKMAAVRLVENNMGGRSQASQQRQLQWLARKRAEIEALAGGREGRGIAAALPMGW